MNKVIWNNEKFSKPIFGKEVLTYCSIYGLSFCSYEKLDEDLPYGNWKRNGELGILPPTHWVYLDKPSEANTDIL